MKMLLPVLAVAGASIVSLAAVALAPPRPAGAPGGAAAPPPASEPSGQRLAFDFKDPKGVNAVGIFLDSTLEPMFGSGSGISGTVEIDPLDPFNVSGTLAMDATMVRMTNERMTEVLHGADWLDVANHPTIEVKLVSVEDAVPVALNTFECRVVADVSVRGTTHRQPVVIRGTYLPGRLGDRLRGAQGDLLVLRSSFVVKRSDFRIKLDTSTEVVADEIVVTAAVVGSRRSGS